MTALFTCSYRAYRVEMGQAVVTSRGLPHYRPEAASWPRCWLLTPVAGYFDAPDDEFDRAYTAQLARHGPAKISRTLERIARDHGADSLVLLCHEPDWQQCHRLLIAQFLLEVTGELVQEVL